MFQTSIGRGSAQDVADVRSAIESLVSSTRTVISNLDSYSLERPLTYGRVCELSVSFVDFVEVNSETIYSELEGVLILLEGSDHLGQLRLLAEGLMRLPEECNGRLLEMFSRWNFLEVSVRESWEKYLSLARNPFFPVHILDDPKDSAVVLKRLSLFNASYFIFRFYLRTLRERCAKLLGILNAVAETWMGGIEGPARENVETRPSAYLDC